MFLTRTEGRCANFSYASMNLNTMVTAQAHMPRQ